MMKNLLLNAKNFFSDIEEPGEPRYDPVHVGSMIVFVLFANTVLFWLLWSLLVFGGGLQAKIFPVIELIFTKKTAADLGYIGYPYELGAFNGWLTNVTAFVILLALIAAGWVLFKKSAASRKG